MADKAKQDVTVTDRNEVAALMGVETKTLPQGPCTAAPTILEFEYADVYDQIVPARLEATAYTWHDANDRKIFEVNVPADKDSSLRYQTIDYDSEGRIDYREDVKNGKTDSNRVYYYDNGQIASARYGTTFGYDKADQIRKYDREGKLHSVRGYADEIYSYGFGGGSFRGHYYIHGQEYSHAEYKRHPEYKAAHSPLKAFARVAARVGNLFAGNDDAPRETALPVDQMIAAVGKLSPEEKQLLRESLGPSRGTAERTETPAATTVSHRRLPTP